MTHLSIEEIIKYVTATKVDNETLDLLSKVNVHIRTCPSCREKLESYERVNDEFKKTGLQDGFNLNQSDDLNKIKKFVSKEQY